MAHRRLSPWEAERGDIRAALAAWGALAPWSKDVKVADLLKMIDFAREAEPPKSPGGVAAAARAFAAAAQKAAGPRRKPKGKGK